MTNPTHLITVHVFPLSLLATSQFHIGLCAFLFCHTVSETSQFKRQLWSAFFFQGPVFRVFGCWIISLSDSVQFSSQLYFRRIVFGRFRKTAQSCYKLRRVCLYVCPPVSVRMKQLGSQGHFNGI